MSAPALAADRRALAPLVAGLAVAGAAAGLLFSADAVTGLARTGLAAVAFFALCGYGPARLLLDERMRQRLWLYTLPIGAACGTLALTLLGLLRVPLTVSLAVVLVTGAALAVVAVRRVPSASPSGRTADFLLPVVAGLLIAGVACLPSVRAGFPTVQGQNGDAVLAVGTAAFLQEAPPGAVRPELGLDRVPLLWRSKLPIYYGFAAVSRLAGQNPVTAFTGMVAVTMALAALGFYLFARDGLRVAAPVALGAMVVLGLSRGLVHVAYGPFYNQVWGMLALPFALLFGWRFLCDPGRRSAALAVLFLALALLAYPLLLPFPLVFLAVIAWQRRRERGWWRALRLPAARSAGVRYALIAVVAVPVTVVLGRGVVEKVIPGMRALWPGGDLTGWSGGDVLPYLPFGWFFGVSAPSAVTAFLLVAVFVAALAGLWRLRGDGGVALGIVVAGALLGAVYVLARGEGELFYFKALSFTGPLVIVLAVVGMARLRPRLLAVAAVALFALVAVKGTRDAATVTFDQTPRHVLELREWDREIPVDQTIRIDVPPSGWQLWSWYLMPRHRVSASLPMRGFFPYPPYGLKADLALVFKPAQRPADAIGPPLRENRGFVLYRLNPDAPGEDVSSQRLLWDVNEVSVFN